jgi:DNA-binding transcriptional regulator YiaG
MASPLLGPTRERKVTMLPVVRTESSMARSAGTSFREAEGVDSMFTGEDVSGNEIRELRKRLGLTQEEFAHAVAVTFSTVNRWENGHAKPSKLARRAIEALAATKTGDLQAGSQSIEELTRGGSAAIGRG